MKKILNVTAIAFCFGVFLTQGALSFANGKADPLSIVSEAEVISPDDSAENVSDVGLFEDDSILNDAYVVGPSDKLRVTVYGEKDLSKVYQVDGLGMISVPLVGQIKVAGMTLRQAEDLLIVALSNGYLVDPSVAIEVAEFRPFYIMGEVRRPGSYNYIDGMSVLNAVAVSGGYTYRANTKTIEVIRDSVGDRPIKISPAANVLPGDIIRVKERFF